MEKLKVMIADDNDRVVGVLMDILSMDEGIEVIGTAADGAEACDMIQERSPDIVILDLIMPKLDGLSVMERVNTDKNILKVPKFIVTTAIGQDSIAEDAFSLGAAYYIMKPFDSYAVLNRIKQIGFRSESHVRKLTPLPLQSDKEKNAEQFLENEIARMLHEVSVPLHIKGFQYLREGIRLAVKDVESVNYITKLLYPVVAKHYATTPSRVERSIRHAVEISWSRAKPDTMNRLFGYTIRNGCGKPTNSEFIAVVSDKIRLTYNKVSRQGTD